MGVTFHTLTSTAIAAIVTSWVRPPFHGKRHTHDWSSLLIIFLLCILSHGLLDILPHQYPLPAPLDVGLALFWFVGVMFCARKQARWVLLVCFLGCLLPDMIDLSLPILNQKFGTAFPTYRLFPWHWAIYSGSIFDNKRTFESRMYHGLVLLICGIVLFVQRRLLFDDFSCIRLPFLKYWRQ